MTESELVALLEEMRAELTQLREDYNALETRVFILELDAPE